MLEFHQGVSTTNEATALIKKIFVKNFFTKKLNKTKIELNCELKSLAPTLAPQFKDESP